MSHCCHECNENKKEQPYEICENIVEELDSIGCILKKTNSILRDNLSSQANNHPLVTAYTTAANIGSGQSIIELNIPANSCIKTIFVTAQGTNIRDIQLTLQSETSFFINRYYAEQNDEGVAPHANFVVSFDYPVCIGNSEATLRADISETGLSAGFLSVLYIPNCCSNTPQ
ncbi:hypothetical protein [Alkalibaculum bacchi]|uniref:hypothetical protein n=1 Tax=Alkalibaculum bacchi TaxID=645887 RepID=UPI0026F01BCE|nr:hypothetical protein [Alkalibaculum bacchi]